MSESTRNPITYTQAELISFAIVPKTCVTVEKALDVDFNKASAIFDSVLNSYHIESTKQLKNAFMEALGRITFGPLQDAAKVVKYEATYPLRLALIEMISRELVQHGHQHDKSIYNYWIDSSLHHVKIKPDFTALDSVVNQVKDPVIAVKVVTQTE